MGVLHTRIQLSLPTVTQKLSILPNGPRRFKSHSKMVAFLARIGQQVCLDFRLMPGSIDLFILLQRCAIKTIMIVCILVRSLIIIISILSDIYSRSGMQLGREAASHYFNQSGSVTKGTTLQNIFLRRGVPCSDVDAVLRRKWYCGFPNHRSHQYILWCARQRRWHI